MSPLILLLAGAILSVLLVTVGLQRAQRLRAYDNATLEYNSGHGVFGYTKWSRIKSITQTGPSEVYVEYWSIIIRLIATFTTVTSRHFGKCSRKRSESQCVINRACV